MVTQTTDLRERLKRLRQWQLSYLTADQAKDYGFDLEPDWAVKVDWDEADQPRYTYVSPEQWKFADFTYGEQGEVLDFSAFSPEGKRYTKAELAELEAQQVAPTMQPTTSASEQIAQLASIDQEGLEELQDIENELGRASAALNAMAAEIEVIQ